MKAPSMLLLLALAALPAVAPAARSVTDPDAPRALPEQDPVSVSWEDPAQFSDLRYSGNRWEATRGNWVVELATHLQKSAARRLPEGQRMEVVITDIQRAGRYEPWHGPNLDHVRFMREHYPPRISLNVRILDANGNVLSEGERKLVDSAYLMNTSARLDSDPLRFEKRLIDNWLRRELERGPQA